MLDNKKVSFNNLITKVYDMKDYKEAFNLVKSDTLTFKVILRPNGVDNDEKR